MGPRAAGQAHAHVQRSMFNSSCELSIVVAKAIWLPHMAVQFESQGSSKVRHMPGPGSLASHGVLVNSLLDIHRDHLRGIITNASVSDNFGRFWRLIFAISSLDFGEY